MVEAYWQIGKSIVEEQNGEERAEYGTGLLKELSKQMTQDFGRGFTVANLKNMRQFYLIFPNGYALRSELSWTHYRLLMRVENDNARQFYTDEAVKSQWSTRQLERQINTFFYERLLSSKLQIQVNKSSVEAVDEAQKKQKEAEKKMEQAESKARNEKKRAELEIRKAKKEVKDRTENMKAMECFWGMGYITVVLFAILQNGAFQHDFIDFFMTPFMWYVRFCKWLVYPTYDNGFNQKIAYAGGEVWVIRILAIVAVLFIVGILMVIIMETIKQYKKMWNEISQMFLIGSLSWIAVLGDVIRGYLPVNLILLFAFVNMGIVLLRVYRASLTCN